MKKTSPRLFLLFLNTKLSVWVSEKTDFNGTYFTYRPPVVGGGSVSTR